MAETTTAARTRGFFTRERQQQIADVFAAALAASLPWSTTATAILIGFWLIAVSPLISRESLRKALAAPSGGLPVLLVVLAAVGVAWAAGVPFGERIDGLKSFLRLLAIPLLIMQFRMSERAHWVLWSFLASCSVLLVASSINFFFYHFPWSPKGPVGVLVKDYITQSAEFTICIFLIAPAALAAWNEGRRLVAVALMMLAVLFLLNIVYVLTSRSILVAFPLLLLLFALRHLRWKHVAGGLVAAALLAGVAASAPAVRENVSQLLGEMRNFDPQGTSTRAGERLVFWIKSIEFVASAPVVGHGTGSIQDQFRRSVDGQRGMAALASANPHNQTFAIAIQLGLVGAALLFAMWIAHAMLFWREGYAAWAGLVIVAYGVAGSLVNSLLFDFTSGWGYVIGVGVAAGAVLRNLDARPDSRQPAP